MYYFLMLGAEMAPMSWLAFLLLCMVMLWLARRKYRVKKRWVFGGMLLNNISAVVMYYSCLQIFGYNEVKMNDGGINVFVFAFWPIISGFLICLVFFVWKRIFMRGPSIDGEMVIKEAAQSVENVSQGGDQFLQPELEKNRYNQAALIRVVVLFFAAFMCVILLRRVNEKIEALENRIEYLDSQVNSLESEIEELKSEVENVNY